MIHKLIIEGEIEHVEWRLECELAGKTSDGRGRIVKSVTLTGASKTTGKEYREVMDSSKSDGERDAFFARICRELVDNIGTSEWMLRGSVINIELGLWTYLREEGK